MRINCHCHIFNLRSVFTRETIGILLRRLPREGWDPWLVESASALIKKALGDNAYVDEERMLRQFADEMGKSAKFRQIVKDAGDALPMEVGLIGDGNAGALGLAALKSVFGKLSGYLSRAKAMQDAHHADLWDLIDFLRIGLMPDIADVTDRIMTQLKGDDAIIPLMMDITPGDGSDDDLFEAQTENTSCAVLAYPGRIFPFFAVNPKRADYFQRMHNALEKRGFVGIKLYPSLGFGLDQIEDVFNYCVTTRTPVMVHCSQGGFYSTKATINNGHPKHWRKILEKDAFSGLKICFGHFGGDENLSDAGVTPGSWTEQVLELMTARHPGVYADISYHTAPMDGGDKEKHYFKNLQKLLKDRTTGRRILFGTDYFLVRRRVREESQWTYFQTRLAGLLPDGDAFDRITGANAAEYLGLPAAGDDPGRPNIERYVTFAARNSARWQRTPPPWLKAALTARYGDLIQFSDAPAGPGWQRNNQAHVATYKFFRYGETGQHGYMYASHYDLRFAGSPGLKLRQLPYWNKEHEDPAIFDRKCATMARRFDDFLIANGVVYEKEISQAKAVEKLTACFRDGQKTFADMGAACDALYRFSHEEEESDA